MTPERWQQVKTTLDAMLGVQPALRPARLAELCADDDDLRSEVESLLVFDDEEKISFTKANLSPAITEFFAEVKDAFIGREIGKYKILREIGMGGMGAVYLAERTGGEFDQQVAVKFLRQSFSSAVARQRFVQERRILARLRHPFIAQLIDGGTTDDGTPFLVMEYVEGIPITGYCRKNNLPLRERLDLFRNACEAVSFAHRNLIVHRDLKPDNILIAADGTPKLLDFGIAKLLSNTEIKATVTRRQALTPDYAAPEQLAGRDITTASDIYSLGIILYELLTGAHPFRRRKMSTEQIYQAMILNEPLRPSRAANDECGTMNAEPKSISQSAESKSVSQSTYSQTSHDGGEKIQRSAFSVQRSLKGDLDTITLKALRKEPERRYESVEKFSGDIKSYLKGFPISARPDTFRYRAGKFLRRNPLASAAVFVALVSLMTGVIVAVYQARQANIERARAEKRFNEVRQLANSFMFEINDKIGESPVQARELLVSRAVEYLDALAQEEAGNDAGLQSELATAYEKIGDVQSELFKPNSGKTSEALASHQKSLAIRQKLFAAEPQSIPRGLDVVKSYQNIGGIFSMNGRIGESIQVYTQAVGLCRQLLDEDSNNFEARRHLARSLALRGQSILRSGSLAATLDDYEKSLDIFRQLAAENPNDAMPKRSIAIMQSFIGYVYLQKDQTPAAVRYYEDALTAEEKLAGSDDSLKNLGNLSTANLWYGVALGENGQPEKSLFHLRKALAMQQKVFDADRNNFGERNSLGDCYLELAKVLDKHGAAAEALKNAEQALESYQAVWQRDGSNLTARRQVAYTQKYVADFQSELGDSKAAAENYAQAIESMTALASADPDYIEWKYDLAVCYKNFGEFFLKGSDRRRAAENFNRALPMLENLASRYTENAVYQRDLKTLKSDLAKL